jgi:threonine dehydratase
MPSLPEFQAAAERIRGRVRRTPLLSAAPLRDPVVPGELTLKLESLQVTGSFKARGATNKVLTLSAAEQERGLVTASGGNHGLGVAYAGRLAGAKVTIYLPANVPESKAERLKAWGAEVVREGAVWDDANAVALEAAERHGWTYVHAFADPAIIAGQGTVGLEILQDAPETDLLAVSIGGGGLIAGVAAAAKALKPEIRVIGVEPVGAPTLYESVKAGRVIELAEIRTVANTLAPRKSDPLNLAIIQENVDEIVLVTDDEMRAAARRLWFETGVAVELSGAAALAALATGKIHTTAKERVCAVICGVGVDGIAGASG